MAPVQTRVNSTRDDLTRTVLAILFVVGLIAGSLWIMRPFIPALIWAATLVIATWPAMIWIEGRCGGRRGIAVVAMALVLLVLLIVPLWLAVSTVVENADAIGDLTQRVLSLRTLPLPDWVARTPMLGPRLAQGWEKLTAAGAHEFEQVLAPYTGEMTRWFVVGIGSLGGMLLQLLLTLAIAIVLYARGEHAALASLRFGRRLGADRGEMAVRLGAQAIRGVALGVVVTALAQSLVGGIGLTAVGVPFAPLLTAVMFILCLAQVGPGLVLIPAVVWMYADLETVRATILLGFAFVAVTMDNLIRPLLIRKGTHLPLLLVLAGVIGGLVAAGLLGIFVGPTLLAVSYTLLNAWVNEGEMATLPGAAAELRPTAVLPPAGHAGIG